MMPNIRPAARLFFAFAAILFLSGCWLGDALYTEADARPGIVPGRYRVITPDGAAKVMLVSLRADGMTRIDLEDEPGNPSFFGFAPLDAAAGTYVAWWSPPRSRNQLAYALVRRESGGVYVALLPRCLETQAIVTAAGGTVRPGASAPTCSFPNRESLAAALRALAVSDARNGPELRFIPAPAR
jgi:hypothetical protein